MTILVTGVAGHLAPIVCDLLAEKGADVVGVDVRPPRRGGPSRASSTASATPSGEWPRSSAGTSRAS